MPAEAVCAIVVAVGVELDCPKLNPGAGVGADAACADPPPNENAGDAVEAGA